MGPQWNKLIPTDNPYISFFDSSYKNFPYAYNLDVFASLSIHEGGPLPLLESMCCGCYPVVTNTGFASDIIKKDVHGKISAFSPANEIASLILSTYSLNFSQDSFTTVVPDLVFQLC